MCGCTLINCTSVVTPIYTSKIVGSTQKRIVSDVYKSHVVANNDKYSVSFDTGITTVDDRKHTLIKVSPCHSQDDYVKDTDYQYFSSSIFCGGYIPPEAEEEKHTGKFCALYTYDRYYDYEIRHIVPWDVTGCGRDYTGDFSSGTVGVGDPSSVTFHEEWEESCLMAYIEGETIVIDTDKEDSFSAYYYVTDSHVFKVLNNIYYMYAYSKFNLTLWEPAYTRYGYFVNTVDRHIQSEIYYPADILYRGRKTMHHFVGNSAEYDNRRYGFGKCWGYYLEEVIEETVRA